MENSPSKSQEVSSEPEDISSSSTKRLAEQDVQISEESKRPKLSNGDGDASNEGSKNEDACVVVISEDEDDACEQAAERVPPPEDDDVEEDEDDDDDDDDDDDCKIVSVTQGSHAEYVQHLRAQGLDPRTLLTSLLGSDMSGYQASEDALWHLLLRLVSEPTRRHRLDTVSTLDDVVRLLATCKRILVLTGAGVSVSCGIPDFRSRDGIYARLSKEYPELPDPQSMFDIRYFRTDQRPFFKFAKEIYPGQFTPSRSHRFIKCLEDRGKLLRNYSQNIDTLEQVAGITRVLNCHGSFATASCVRCRLKVDMSTIKEDIMAERIPLCARCTAQGEDETKNAGDAQAELQQAEAPKDKEERAEAQKDGEQKAEAQKDGEQKAEAQKDGEEKTEAQKDGEQKAEAQKDGEQKAEVQKDGEEKAEAQKDGEEKTEAQKDGEEKAEAQKDGEEKAGDNVGKVADKKESGEKDNEGEKLAEKVEEARECSSDSCDAGTNQLQRPVLKPDIVFFGESLPQEFYDCINKDEDEADLLIVMGSSLKVQPVSLIPSSLPGHIPQILINREPLHQHNFDVCLLGDCDQIVAALCERLKWTELAGEPLSEISGEELLERRERAYVDDGSQQSGAAQHEDDCHIAQFLPPNSYAFCPPNKYVFSGAEAHPDEIFSVTSEEDSDQEDLSTAGEGEVVNLVTSEEEDDEVEPKSSCRRIAANSSIELIETDDAIELVEEDDAAKPSSNAAEAPATVSLVIEADDEVAKATASESDDKDSGGQEAVVEGQKSDLANQKTDDLGGGIEMDQAVAAIAQPADADASFSDVAEPATTGLEVGEAEEEELLNCEID